MPGHATHVAVVREGSDVRFGSKADICAAKLHVRCTLKADIRSRVRRCRLLAASEWRARRYHQIDMRPDTNNRTTIITIVNVASNTAPV